MKTMLCVVAGRYKEQYKCSLENLIEVFLGVNRVKHGPDRKLCFLANTDVFLTTSQPVRRYVCLVLANTVVFLTTRPPIRRRYVRLVLANTVVFLTTRQPIRRYVRLVYRQQSTANPILQYCVNPSHSSTIHHHQWHHSIERQIDSN